MGSCGRPACISARSSSTSAAMFLWMLIHPKHSLKSSHLLFNANEIMYLHSPTNIVMLESMNTASLINIDAFLLFHPISFFGGPYRHA